MAGEVAASSLTPAAKARPWSGAAALAGAALLLYLPTLVDLYRLLWRYGNNSQQPIVFAMCAWLLTHQFRRAIVAPGLRLAPRPLAGALVFGFGLVMYVLGRSQAVLAMEVASMLPVFLGAAIIVFGTALPARMWFAFAFLLFAVPLPPSLVDVITQPMKIGVSWAAVNLLQIAGYPVAREGVVLYVGPYQLLVADACAGLNSLFTLEALGLLYLNVVRHESVLRNVMLATLIVPVSFAANSVRVVILALVTYHFGDAAGQGFVHEFAGLVLFLTALAFIISLDGLLRVAAVRTGR